MKPPPIDDHAIWDLWLSQYQLPVVLASDELGVFSVLHAAPRSVAELCSVLGLSERSVLALTGALAAAGFIAKATRAAQSGVALHGCGAPAGGS